MQNYFKYVIDWLDAYNLTVVAVILSAIVAIVRSLPIQLSIFVGGIVGFKGTLWIDRMISKKVGDDL
ncbi:hypothetical protein [Acinetobacter modestus]|uniref:Holin n=1 Tax=Acinetobacter modestus TaxID=1776740 RepID=A0ABP2TY31_9GAMM|nr:hypothetical protein [Acinetobacter modestus]ENU27019.1 hypothetical protein F992_01623 [Acinetobacter modestus]GGA17756.1 hypothetical protein GCM10017554_13150 [Acinetobacter modestus]